MGRVRGLGVSIILLGTVFAPVEAHAATPASFAFAAAGDHGGNEKTAASLRLLNRSKVNFYVALGDLDYKEVSSAEDWCRLVRTWTPSLGTGFPFQLVAGNHEESYIQRHAACLPDRLGSRLSPTRQYAAEYFFDYPARSPLMRAIMIAPGLTINNVSYRYSRGSTRYNWVASQIDAARRAGIRWVVVGMHKNCLSAGGHSCSIGEDLMNLLVAKKVDLVLSGHVHNYQRSKQLAHRAGCAAVPARSYDRDCVVDDGSDRVYTRGRGTVFLIIGMFGKNGSAPDGSDTDAGYFARWGGKANGFVRFVVSASKIEGTYWRSTGAHLADTFTIRP